MLYNEFIELTGATALPESLYHKSVEPRYYDYPGNKQEFCRDWLVRQLSLITETLVDCQNRSRKPEWTCGDQEVWNASKRMFATYSEKLVKINKFLGY